MYARVGVLLLFVVQAFADHCTICIYKDTRFDKTPMDCKGATTPERCFSEGSFEFHGKNYSDCNWTSSGCRNRFQESCVRRRSELGTFRTNSADTAVDTFHITPLSAIESSPDILSFYSSCSHINLIHEGHGIGHFEFIKMINSCAQYTSCSVHGFSSGCSTFSDFHQSYETKILPILEDLKRARITPDRKICIEGHQCINVPTDLSYSSPIRFQITPDGITPILSMCHSPSEQCMIEPGEKASCLVKDPVSLEPSKTYQVCCTDDPATDLGHWQIGKNCPDLLSLQNATRMGLVKTVVLLLNRPDAKTKWKADAKGRTLLFDAAEAGHADIVEVMLNHDWIEKDPIDSASWTPLMLAAKNRHNKVVSKFVTAGVDVKDSLFSSLTKGEWDAAITLVQHAPLAEYDLPRIPKLIQRISVELVSKIPPTLDPSAHRIPVIKGNKLLIMQISAEGEDHQRTLTFPDGNQITGDSATVRQSLLEFLVRHPTPL
jgi:hypothetical protein